MIPQTIEVGERLTLRLCQTEKFKTEMLSLSATFPIQRDQTYLTSLLLSVLLRGSERYPTVSAINRRLDYLYGTELSVRNFYRGDSQVFGLCANVLGKDYIPDQAAAETLLSQVVGLMRELLFSPALDENGLLNAHYVESEKQLQCDTIRARKNHPHGYALDCCRRLMYENEPCGVSIYGTEEEVMRVTPEALTAHWRALCKDLHLHAFYVGASDAESVKLTLATAFGTTPNPVEANTPTGAVISLTDPASIRPHTPTLVREEELAVKQGQLVLGLRTGAAIQSEDFFACALFNELLGASPVSKLFVNVREKLGLCYSCSSAYNAYKASILISCGIENENRELAEREILAQINAIAAGAFSDEEWNAAQKSMENAYRQLEDSPVGMENYYFGRALVGLSVDPTLACARFAALKREDVMRVAKGTQVDTVFFLRQVGGEEEVCDDED